MVAKVAPALSTLLLRGMRTDIRPIRVGLSVSTDLSPYSFSRAANCQMCITFRWAAKRLVRDLPGFGRET